MRKLIVVLIVAALASAGLLTRGAGQGIDQSRLPEDPPNLLYIIVDEMREMAMSCSEFGNIKLVH